MIVDRIRVQHSWETNEIFLNVLRYDGTYIPVSVDRKGAELLVAELICAIQGYDDMDELCRQHDEAMEKEKQG